MKVGNFTFMMMLLILLTLAYAAGREHGHAEAQAKAEFRRNLEPLLAECISKADKATEERSVALHMAQSCCSENLTIYSANFSMEE
jgi:hypothetical protein